MFTIHYILCTCNRGHVSGDDGNTRVPFNKNVLSVASLPLTLACGSYSCGILKGQVVAGIAASKKRLIEKGMKSP